MRKLAVVGSRTWRDEAAIAEWIDARYAEEGQFMLVSGGATGANMTAEAYALSMGMPVISLRPVTLSPIAYEQRFAVDEWRLFRGAGEIVHHHVPTWSDWASAALYRSWLIAERAEEGVAFWDGHSPGTQVEIGLFAALSKDLKVITP